ncbi:Cellulosome-anchoring protein [bioreactor metagenome]|uniref:Cellulosome-anchoring protein n=1 Tax=bioreactor metagenome TaxID=1076179 RepID=A0A645HTV9_9ZZZZ
MTRAMFATVIGRLYERSYGDIAPAEEHAFTDCDYSDYYGKYVDWAFENGIAGGTGGGLFEPDMEITREEAAVILYRFADFLNVLPYGMDTELSCPDAGNISSWAKNAALYCQSTGIITGRGGGNFVPHGTATRAEASVMLERFVEYIV